MIVSGIEAANLRLNDLSHAHFVTNGIAIGMDELVKRLSVSDQNCPLLAQRDLNIQLGLVYKVEQEHNIIVATSIATSINQFIPDKSVYPRVPHPGLVVWQKRSDSCAR